MRDSKAVKLALGIVSTALFLSVPSAIVHADSNISVEQGVAGISAVLANTTDQQLEDAYNALKASEESAEKVSPYANLGVSVANEYVNIRKEASTESEITGKLYRGCAADILETLDNGWVKIKSGDVEGYIASEFLAIGEEAESMVDEYATIYATVDTQTLKVRSEPTTDSETVTLIPEGETYVVKEDKSGWVKIVLGNDEDTEYTGYVSRDYVDIKVEFKYAISIEEENRILQAQQEAIQAEKERKEKLAQEEAERKEASRKAAEAATTSQDKSDSSTDSSKASNSSTGSGDSSSYSSLREEVVAYALKFVGNPYVYGGTSLTNGIDCSAFVRAIYADFGYSLPRTSVEQSSVGKKVSVSELLPGDLIFYAYSSGRVHHVAMYIGNGRIVHAATTRQGIITSQYNYNDIYCVRRIIY